MEFLIFAVVVAIAVYVGYKYYQAKTVTPDVYVLPESAEVKIEPLDVVNVEVGDVSLAEAEKRVRKNGKFVADDPSTPDVNEAFKDGKPKKKKPNIKIAK